MINIDAVSKRLAQAVNDGFAASLTVAVNVLLPTAKLSGRTRACVGPRTTLTAGAVHIEAHDVESKALATVTTGTVAALAVSVVDSDATVTGTTEAFVGQFAVLQLGGSSLTLKAWSPVTRAEASTRGVSGGALASVSVFSVHAEIGDDVVFLPPATFTPGGYAPRASINVRSVTRAFIGDDVTVVAGTTHLDADSDAQTNATIKHAGIAGFVSVGVAEVKAITNHDTEAFIGARGTITLTGALTLDADDNLRAIPTLEAFALAGVLSVSVFMVHYPTWKPICTAASATGPR